MRALKSLIFLFLFLLIILSRPLFGASSTVDYLCELGITFYNLGQYDAALVEFKKALMIEPGNQTAKNYIMDLTHQGPPAAPLPKKEIPKPKKKEIKEPELKKPKAPEPEKPKLPEPKKEIKRPPPKKEKIIAPKVKKPEVKKEKIEELAQPEEPEITEPEKEAVEIPAQTIIKEIPIYRLNLQELIAEARRNIKKAEGKIKEEEEFQLIVNTDTGIEDSGMYNDPDGTTAGGGIYRDAEGHRIPGPPAKPVHFEGEIFGPVSRILPGSVKIESPPWPTPTIIQAKTLLYNHLASE